VTGALRPVALALAVLLFAAPAAQAKNKKQPAAKFLSADEIYRQALRELEQDDLRQAQSLLEQVTYTTEDRSALEPLVRLAIADSTFYQRYGVALIDARSLYQDFVALYGDHALAPYAQFQAGVCSLKQVVHPSRDQAQTHQAIADLRLVVERWSASRFAVAARLMIRQAERNLAEHEFTVGRFYLNRKAPAAAIERFRGILDRYPHFDELDKVYFYLSQAQLGAGNDVEARIYLDKLVKDFPNGAFVDEAQKQLERAGGPLESLELGGND